MHSLQGMGMFFEKENAVTRGFIIICFLAVVFKAASQQSTLSPVNTSDELPKIWIPDCFTPNNDQLNDRFAPVTCGFSKVDLSIYSPQGELIFQSSEFVNEWDGNCRGGECPEQLYFWSVRAMDVNGKSYRLKGKVLLLRPGNKSY